MKTKKMNTKLSLNKTTLANLNSIELNNLKGGTFVTILSHCGPCSKEYPCTIDETIGTCPVQTQDCPTDEFSACIPCVSREYTCVETDAC